MLYMQQEDAIFPGNKLNPTTSMISLLLSEARVLMTKISYVRLWGLTSFYPKIDNYLVRWFHCYSSYLLISLI